MKKTRSVILKILILMLINVMVFSQLMPILVSSVSASANMEVKIDNTFTGNKLNIGDKVTVNIIVKDESIAGISGFLNYDTNIFKTVAKRDFTLAEELDSNSDDYTGTYGEWNLSYTASTKKLMITETSGDKYTIPNNGLVATLTLEVIAEADYSEVSLTTVEVDGSTNIDGDGGYHEYATLLTEIIPANKPSSDDSTEMQIGLEHTFTGNKLNIGDKVTVNIIAKNESIAGISGFLNYDTNVFKTVAKRDFTLAEELDSNSDDYIGTYGEWNLSYTASTKKLMITETSGDKYTIPNNGIIATLTLEVIAEADYSEVSLTTVEVDGSTNIDGDGGYHEYDKLNAEIPSAVEKHTVTYDYGTNGGQNSSGNLTETQEVSEGSLVPLPTGIKTGYDFVGWNTDEDATTALSSISMEQDDITVYAIYKKDIEITFKSCNGTVQVTHSPNVIATFYNNNEDSTLITFPTAKTCTKDNATWVHEGWTTSTSTSLTGNEIREGTIKSIKATETEFYMIYSKQVTVAYDMNGNGDITGNAPTSQSGKAYMNSNIVTTVDGYKPTLATPTATRAGYEFDKWNITADGLETDYTAGTTPTTGFTANTTTLYAQWTANTNTQYKIKYYKQDGNDLSNYIEQTADEEIKEGTTGTIATAIVDNDKYGSGYEFNSTNSVTSGTIIATGDGLILQVRYKVKGDRKYIVERYLEDGDNPGTYNLVDTYTYENGITGQTVTAPSKANDYTGYTEHLDGSEASGTVVSDNDNPLVLRVYYTANTDTKYYIDYYKQDANDLESYILDSSITDIRTGRTGASIDITLEAKKDIQGYTFDPNVARTLQTGIVSGDESTRLRLCYSANDTAYKIEHYIQDVNGNYQLDVSETENLTAKTGALVTATAKSSILDRGYVEDTINLDRVVSGNVTPDGSFTLKIYYKVLLTITLDNNDGTSTTPTTFQVPYGDTYGSNLTNLTRTGYDHNSRWTKVADDETTMVSTSDVVTSAHTLYAYWTPKKYRITYNSLGGSTVTDLEAEYNSTFEQYYTNQKLPETTRTGYNFEGWFRNIDDNGDVTGDEVQLTDIITEDITLYAKWTPIPTVYFDKNCNDSSIIVDPASKEVIVGQAYGNLQTLSGRIGYTFEGWYFGIDGEGNVTGDKVSADTIVTNENHHTLYANWIANQYQITFDKNTNYNIEVTPSSKTVTYDQIYGDLPDLTGVLGDGYVFEGWWTKPDNSGKKIIADNIVDIAKDQILYAQWTPREVTVIFKYIEPVETNEEEYPEGIERSIELSFDYDTVLSTSKLKSALSKKGVDLDEITSKTFNTPKYTYTVDSPALDLSEVRNPPQNGRLIKLDEPTTISVVYNKEIRKYDVTFYDEDKTTVLGTVKNTNYGDTASDASIVVQQKRDETNIYDWQKWKNVEDNSDVVFPYIITKETKVYADYKATPIDYTVKFLDEDGTILMSKEDYHYGDTIVLPNVPTKDRTQQYSYEFDYWVDELGNHSNGMTLLTPTVDGNKTFTAVYKSTVNKYKITFWNDAGDTVLDEDEVDYGTDALWNRTNDKQIPIKENSNGYSYEFDNKWLKEDRQTEDDLTNVTEDRNVYPAFKSNTLTYTITYKYLMGAINNPNPKTYTVEDADITLQALEKRPGLKFLAWYDDEEYLNEITTIATSEIRDRIIYAKWDVEELMYFVKSSQNIDNNEAEVIIFKEFEKAQEYVDTLFDNGKGQAQGVYDMNNDLVYYPRAAYYIKASEDIDNESAIKHNNFEEAKEYVDTLFEQDTLLKIFDKNNKLIYDPSDIKTEEVEVEVRVEVEVPIVKYFVKDSDDINNEQAIEYASFDEAKDYVDTLFEQGTTTRIYDFNNKLVYEPKEEEPIEIPIIKYFVKVNKDDPNIDENTFDLFNDAKKKADEQIELKAKVYDINGDVVYEPKEEEPIEIPIIKYFVKVNKDDPNTDENTFDLFDDAKEKADEQIKLKVKVYDINGDIVYEPKEDEELYLKIEKYRIGENNLNEYEKGDTYFYRIDPYITLSQFIEMCDTNGNITIYKQSGELLQDEEFVGTGMTLRDEKDGKSIWLMLSVKGDIDGNGKITATDLAAMNQQILKDIELSGAQLLAADLNIDNKTTATDLAAVNQAILKELDLTQIN